MRANRSSIKILFGQGKTAFESGKPVLEVAKLLTRHQVNDGKLVQGLNAGVIKQGCFTLVVIDTKTGCGVHSDVGVIVLLFKLQQRCGDVLSLRGKDSNISLSE